MPTVRIRIHVPDQVHEILLAELADLGFDAFEQGARELIAYAPAARWDDARRERIERWLAAFGGPYLLEEEVMPDENWNARWEASIEPLEIGPFLVKPSWHPDVEHAGGPVLEIDPKMSFGTGYHASTRLALRLLPEVVHGGEQVLDAGCGTGILALAALKLGAARAIGFDIDPWAAENARENAVRNDLADRFELREGSLESVPEEVFDVVLANINRNVLLDMLPLLQTRMSAGGRLVLAGLLREDRDEMLAATRDLGLYLRLEGTEAEWWGAVWTA